MMRNEGLSLSARHLKNLINVHAVVMENGELVLCIYELG